MKKLITILLCMILAVSCGACALDGADGTENTEETRDPIQALTHDEYVAVGEGERVIVEAYVQAAQSWWNKDDRGAITVYAQDENGGYFIYEMICSEEDAAELQVGTRIRVTGTKSVWHGLNQVTGATFEIMDGNYIAEAIDVTELLETKQLIDHQNEFVSFTGMTVEASQDANGNDVAFLYGMDGTSEDGGDLYFKVSANGETYTFVVESSLCGSGTDAYEAVKALQIGDKINLEGFLYWYDGLAPNVTAVTKVTE